MQAEARGACSVHPAARGGRVPGLPGVLLCGRRVDPGNGPAHQLPPLNGARSHTPRALAQRRRARAVLRCDPDHRQ